MPPGKVISSADEAVADISDGAVIMVAGYAVPGTPQNLVKALLIKGVGDLMKLTNQVWNPSGFSMYQRLSPGRTGPYGTGLPSAQQSAHLMSCSKCC